MFKKPLLLVALLMILPALLFASGMIRGKVVDKDSREPLVGTNVSLQGTTLGAATDVNGEYIIVNVPPGVFTVKATFIGYQPFSVSNVRVNNDLTTTIDFVLAAEAVALQAVEIVADRPLLNRSATNAVRISTSDDLDALPARGINSILAVTPGVVVQDGAVFVRGGRLDEVGYYLEGMSITNPMAGGRAVTLVQDAVEEIQVQAGGYNAEFGGANSGIIQQSLKTGTSAWKASAQYITDNISLKTRSKAYDGEKQLGAYWFGYNEFTGTASGPLVSEKFKFFGLFNYLYQRDQNPQPYPGINLGLISGPTNDTINLVYPAGALRQNPRQDYNVTSTLTMDFNPVTARLAGTYTASSQTNIYNTCRNAGAIANILNESRTEEVKSYNGSGSLRVTHLLSPKTYYEITAGYFYQSQKNWDPYLQDNFMAYGDSVANAAAGFVWTRTAAEVSSGQTGRYIRQARKSLFDYAFNAPGDVVAGYAKFKREGISLTGALVTQLGSEQSLKIGGEFSRYSIRNYALGNDNVFSLAGIMATNSALADGDPNKLTPEQVMVNVGVNSFGYDALGTETNESGILGARHPVFASAYVQDKIEYKDLIVNVGLRFDYINTDNYKMVDLTRPELSMDYYSGAIHPEGMVKVSPFQGLSPRLGLSFPVTDRTIFHTQFGQFVQQSRLRDLYQGYYSTSQNVRGGFFIHTPVGFDVRPERTTQYEIGFTQQMGDFISVDATAFYKDIKDQVLFEQVNTAQGSPFGSYYIFHERRFCHDEGHRAVVQHETDQTAAGVSISLLPGCPRHRFLPQFQSRHCRRPA